MPLSMIVVAPRVPAASIQHPEQGSVNRPPACYLLDDIAP